MKSIYRVSVLCLAVLGLGASPLRAERLFEDESLGGLELGQRSDVVTKVLGKPESRGKEVLWEAIGEWRFPKQGLVLNMSSDKKGGEKTILSITAEAPCRLATSRGIKIGSTEAELAKAYRDMRNKEESSPGERFVAGSIYGGVIFDLKNGKVVQIFIGAAAE